MGEEYCAAWNLCSDVYLQCIEYRMIEHRCVSCLLCVCSFSVEGVRHLSCCSEHLLSSWSLICCCDFDLNASLPGRDFIVFTLLGGGGLPNLSKIMRLVYLYSF
jgi:hypothetical protein